MTNELLPFPENVKTIRIIIVGEPVPKGRPRARIVKPHFKQPFIQFYQHAETEAYERQVAIQSKIAMSGRGPCIGALRIEVFVYLPIPKSWSARQQQKALDGLILPIGRPDADNFLKIIDGCNKICWHDDAQIVDMRVTKRYSDNPRLEIHIFPA